MPSEERPKSLHKVLTTTLRTQTHPVHPRNVELGGHYSRPTVCTGRSSTEEDPRNDVILQGASFTLLELLVFTCTTRNLPSLSGLDLACCCIT